MITGSIVALVTPMFADGQIDFDAITKLIEMHIQAGTQAIAICGTTGEAPTLTNTEQEQIIKATIATVAGRIPVIVGTGTYSTQDTIERTVKAHQLGADASLVVTPYYNKPTQSGLIAHFTAVAASAELPMILYNNPTRTACDLLPETVQRLAKVDNIIGIKEAHSDPARAAKLRELCGPHFALYTGNDETAFTFLKQGGDGIISVTANVAPKAMQEMCRAVALKHYEEADIINAKLMALHDSLFIEPNPIPVKWALNYLGWINKGIRLPLTPLSHQNQQRLLQAIAAVPNLTAKLEAIV